MSTWSAEVSTWSATSVWHVDGRTSPAAGASGDRVVETAERYSRGGGVFALRAAGCGSARRYSSYYHYFMCGTTCWVLPSLILLPIPVTRMTELNPFCFLDY